MKKSLARYGIEEPLETLGYRREGKAQMARSRVDILPRLKAEDSYGAPTRQ